MATGLDRFAALQAAPFGTSSSVRRPGATAVGGSAGSLYRKQAEDYNMATRLLRRQARRGDAGSALDLIKVREDAANAGFNPGGIRRKEEFDADIAGSIQSRARGAADRATAADLMRRRTREQLEPDFNPDNSYRRTMEQRDTGATGATEYGDTSNPPVNTGPSSGYPTMSSPTGSADVFAPDTTIAEMAGSVPDAKKWWNPGARRNVANPLADTPTEYRPRAAAAPREGMINGRPASEVRSKLKALMAGGQPGSALPEAPRRATEVDAVGEFSAARNAYQGGDGTPSSAYQPQYSERMRELRKNATPEELRRMDVISATGKDPGAPKQTQGRYKGSKPGIVDQYLAEVENYQAGLASGAEGYADANERANEIYRSGNSLDQAKMAGAILRRAAKLNKLQSRK